MEACCEHAITFNIKFTWRVTNLTVPIDSSHHKGQYFQYTCLPNGLASVPRILTKLLKAVYSALWSAGHLSPGYIDDFHLQGDTFCGFLTNEQWTINLKEGRDCSVCEVSLT